MLDPALTLEYLETHGVPVVGYQWGDFPGYYTRSSGQKVPICAQTLESLTRLVQNHWELETAGGVVITTPVSEEHSLDFTYLNNLIQDAIATCSARGVTGQGVTPFILKEISMATQGKSDLINRSALISTASLAAEVASYLE